MPLSIRNPKAEKLAREIAIFPQVCMRNDRLSAYEQFGMNLEAAIDNEFKHGIKTLLSGEYLEGSTAFTQGTGKHGKFNE